MGNHDKGFDKRNSAQSDPAVYAAAGVGELVPAVLRLGRYHHCRALLRRQRPGVGRVYQFGKLSDFGIRDRGLQRVCDPDRAVVRRAGLFCDAASCGECGLAVPGWQCDPYGADSFADTAYADSDANACVAAMHSATKIDFFIFSLPFLGICADYTFNLWKNASAL